MYGRMSSMRDSMKIWHEKSSELRKFWNWTMNAVCSSSLLSAKLMDEARRMARMLPSLRTITPSRTSLIGTNSCVERLVGRVAVCVCGSAILADERIFRGAHGGNEVFQRRNTLSIFGIRGTCSDALLNIEAPRKVM